MNVLVIGGTGFLSSAVTAELREAGHEVTVFTRGRRPVPEGVRRLEGDRRDEAAFAQQLEGRAFDAVVDCICYTPEDARSALRAFSGRVGRYVLISTDFVYGHRRVLPVTEETATRALNTYGRLKAAAEDLLFQAWREERFPVTVLRPPHIMGAGGQLGTGSLQGRDPMLLDRLARGAPLVLLDGGALLIQPVVHRDIGKACAACLASPAAAGRAYNVAGPDCVTTLQYYELVAATLGLEEQVEVLSIPSALYVRAFPEKAPFARHRTYSVDRLEADTGYRPGTSLPHAVFEMVDWLQANEAAEPYVPTEREERVIDACRGFRGAILDALTG